LTHTNRSKRLRLTQAQRCHLLRCRR
jgi:hypothetical protein